MPDPSRLRASVVVRAHNAESTVGRALESALGQDVPAAGFEVVVVDDGSTDGTRSVLSRYVGRPGVVIVDQENRGAVAAANVGFRAARGPAVVLLDSDDTFEPGLLRRLAGALEADPRADYAYSDYHERLGDVSRVVRPRSVFESVAVGVLFRRSSLEGMGFFREDVAFAEYDLFLRAAGLWKGVHVEGPLFTYHRSRGSLTGDPGRVERWLLQLETLHPTKRDLVQQIRSYALQDVSG